jgi:membrane associated rhomboid family serine protease
MMDYNMKAIQSESRFVWKLILQLLLTPFTLILFVFGKRKLKDIFQPFIHIFHFLFEAKFTITIIMINIAVYFFSFYLKQDTLQSLILYPSDILSFKAYTLVTSGFLHANITHLIGNMIGIFIFGRILERRLGTAKTALIYFGALIISNIFSSVIHLYVLGDNAGGIGASGALMGLVATAMLIDPFYITYELLLPLPVMFVGWLTLYADVTGILNPVEDGIGHFAHIGGFLSIAVIMYFLGIEDRKRMQKGLMVNIVSLVIIAASYYYFFM